MAWNVVESYVCKENKFVDIFFFKIIFIFSTYWKKKQT